MNPGEWLLVKRRDGVQCEPDRITSYHIRYIIIDMTGVSVLRHAVSVLCDIHAKNNMLQI
jgi:hypothetical protein